MADTKNGKELKLGIAKLGELLFNQKIGQTQSNQSLNGIVLQIPDYQRPYKWTVKNANQLLDDIEEAMNSNKEMYRVGTLILYETKPSAESNGNASDNTVYEIVDGQQRIITFSLLLKCLGEKPAFLNQNLAKNYYNINNVQLNYLALGRRIDQLHKNDKSKQNLLDYIKNRCELIIVITKNLSEAFQFFDSQNARGKALYPHDLLKAYHLREMRGVDTKETEDVVRTWEDLNQKELSRLFEEYLYRLKEWVKGNRPDGLTENNIEIFKGVSARDNYPYAQYYKGAFAYADEHNRTYVPFVTGERNLRPFQINAPIIAGKAFFEYTRHYFEILKDIQNNNKYEGYFINDNEIVKTLETAKYKYGTGNQITRLLFDTAILLYVDRFCPDRPSKTDLDYLDQFVVYAFVWAYSMRAQYNNVGWRVAQNFVMEYNSKLNSLNIYKVISDSDSPANLLSRLANKLKPLKESDIADNQKSDNKNYDKTNMDDKDNDNKDNENKVYLHYLHFFIKHRFWEDTTNG
jgi:hypothetical protein